ncbi:TPA: hypothetical protein ACGCGJ_001188 [Stenotrophomonas maltophilia]
MEVLITRCLVQRGGRMLGHCEADTVIIDGVPHVVFEWEGDEPAVTAPLDPSRWHQFPDGQATHLYELPVVDPRPLS